MDLERAARESGVVRPEHVTQLIRSLKLRDYRWIVCNPSSAEPRLQGDLILQIPVAVIDPAGKARSRNLTAMVLNNACDLQSGRSEFISLAPVEDFSAFSEAMLNKDRDQARQYLNSLQANQIDELLYLPRSPQLPNGGVVRFDLISSLSATVYESAIAGSRRLASLTQNGFYLLLMKLTHFLARPESAEIVRDSQAQL